MKRQAAARRRVRKRKSAAENSRMKFRVFFGIMIMAVVLGYLTARFIVGPIIGYDADVSPAKMADESQEKAKKASSAKEAEEKIPAGVKEAPDEGFSLQFGAFSTEEAAEALVETLKSQGIDAEIITADGIYKVISPIVDTKEKALKQLEALSEKDIEDVFVASFG